MTPLEMAYFNAQRKVTTLNILNIIIFGTTLLLLIAELTMIALQLVLPNYGIITHYITGKSMQPTIYEGWSIIIDTNVTVNDLKVGDIISYHENNHNICHRIHHRMVNNNNELAAKGDHNEAIDATFVTNDNLNGKVIATIPYGEWLVKYNIIKLGLITLALDLIAYLIGIRVYDAKTNLYKIRPLYWTFIYNNTQLRR